MSDLPCAQNALKDFFKYKETIEGLHRDDYSDEDWIALLEAELEAGRPILYSGESSWQADSRKVCLQSLGQ